MEEQKKKGWLDNKSVKVTITIVMVAGLIAISYDLFLSPTTPEERETDAKELARELTKDFTNNEQIDQGRSGLAELDYGKTEPVEQNKVVIPLHDADNHTHDKVTMIPMTILDMVHFLNAHPELSDDDSMILMSYAVGKETGMDADKEVDHLAYHIMEKLE